MRKRHITELSDLYKITPYFLPRFGVGKSLGEIPGGTMGGAKLAPGTEIRIFKRLTPASRDGASALGRLFET